jgi:hypothetical protein
MKMKGKNMIGEITSISAPDWLMEKELKFDLVKVLKDSLFYPCSGFDGKPVKLFRGNVHSFVYADYGRTREEFIEELKCRPFKDFVIVHQQSIYEDQLYLNPNGYWNRSFNILHHPYRREVLKKSPVRNGIVPFFSEWIVLQNSLNERFSLLYVSVEALSVYMALYKENKVAPRIITIIRPGTGFGLNWTDFETEDGYFGKAILEEFNPSTEYIAHSKDPWKSFPEEICKVNFYVHLWGK